MSKWIRIAEDTVAWDKLNISPDLARGAYLVYAPWDMNLYITFIADKEMGIRTRRDLRKNLDQLKERFPGGIPRSVIETSPLPAADSDLMVKISCYIADKIRKERKKWMPFQPEPRGWEDLGGTTTEKAIKSINRPEENWESSSL